MLLNITPETSTNISCNSSPAKNTSIHGPLARYVQSQVALAPGMPGTFYPPPRFSDPDMHHGTCVTHVPWCMPGSLTRGFLWSRYRGKRSQHSWRMRNQRFYVSGKRPIMLDIYIGVPIVWIVLYCLKRFISSWLLNHDTQVYMSF